MQTNKTHDSITSDDRPLVASIWFDGCVGLIKSTRNQLWLSGDEPNSERDGFESVSLHSISRCHSWSQSKQMLSLLSLVCSLIPSSISCAQLPFYRSTRTSFHRVIRAMTRSTERVRAPDCVLNCRLCLRWFCAAHWTKRASRLTMLFRCLKSSVKCCLSEP